MTVSTSLAVLLGGLILNIPQGVGDSAVRLLDIPRTEDVVRCERSDKQAKVPRVKSAFTFNIGDGPPGPWRTITVSFDADGNPVMLMEATGYRMDQTVVHESIGVGFQADGSASGLKTRMEGSVLDPTKPPSDMKKIDATEDEVGRARALAAWLWNKRCPQS
jgi:hypothetical protein